MQKLELSSEKISAWHDFLPDDVKSVVPNDAKPVDPAALEALVSDLMSAGSRRIPEVIGKHAEILALGGRARRVRLLAWAMNRAWDNAADMVREITQYEEDDESGEDGRGKIAPFFMADIDAMTRIVAARIVRASTDNRTLDALSAGLKDFEVSYDIRVGGMG